MAAAALIDPPSGRQVTLDRGDVVSFVTPSYLGLERDPRVAAAVARAAREWGISTVTPRALLRDPLTSALERRLADFVAQPAALVFPSARHAACDTLPILAGRRGLLCVDSWAYPTSADGVREAARYGARVTTFPHSDVVSLRRQLLRASGPKVIVTDGVYVSGGAAAPLLAYIDIAERCAAIIYMDDSHGVGLLGRRIAGGPPFGAGGGGLLRYTGMPGHRVVVAGTLSKAFGSPVAFVAGDAALLSRVAATSPSYVHSSPPSIPNLAAALAALTVQETDGDRLRRRVRDLGARFRAGVGTAGLALGSPSVFPIQTVTVPNDVDGDIGDGLMAHGVWPLVQHDPPDCPGRRVVRFFLTALHTPADIDRAVDALRSVIGARVRAAGAPRVHRRGAARSHEPARRPRAPHEIRPRISQTAAAGASRPSTGSC